jgi:hypothetical protein
MALLLSCEWDSHLWGKHKPREKKNKTKNGFKLTDRSLMKCDIFNPHFCILFTAINGVYPKW